MVTSVPFIETLRCKNATECVVSKLFYQFFSGSVRQSGSYPNYSSGTLWPPFRLPLATHPSYEDPRKLLLSRTFHAILFVLLYKATRAPTLVNEQLLALVIYLLDMAVSLAHQSITQGNVSLVIRLSTFKHSFIDLQ